jgi:hypothetical protein
MVRFYFIIVVKVWSWLWWWFDDDFGEDDLLMYECKYLMMQKVGYWWDILYDGENYIILSCELCIVESLLEKSMHL